MKEQWKPVPGWKGRYEVSSFGRMRSLARVTITAKGHGQRIPGRIMTPSPDSKGYYQVTFRHKNRRGYGRVHKLVMTMFVGPCPDGYEVNHIDSDKSNNKLDNLEYVTHRENLIHRPYRFRKPKLTPDVVRKIRAMDATDMTRKAIAKQFDISLQTVYEVVHRITWSSVD